MTHNLIEQARAQFAREIPGRKVALQFSGGKDSLVLLYLLDDFIQAGMPVYWTNTGDNLPETLRVVQTMRARIPNFHEINADVLTWKSRNGICSDVVTSQSSWGGAAYGMSDVRLVGRFECCWFNRLQPMHQRMLDDGIEVVIRGTKLSDYGKVPAVGKTDVYDVMLPLMHWSKTQVFEFLDSVDAPRNPIYQFISAASLPDCLHCTAAWGDQKSAYLRAFHPQAMAEYKTDLQTIRAELAKRVLELDSEIKECDR
jgi:3'-phosphoadenosine 5'-phosphosulfate sulfotransferase (PAPS reductase)/FAD synthetase